ncbi:MSHA biogenesis protein MshP [Vibrio sp. SCSIO 43136]|uniref:MSHA biogenesis protein MshP n=1 Tax=Vibrio sp. SCSIO 43136 TaxID=2819101 RepID=UPI0020752F6F|nr:MSHA biogenesis protein MshP [Vibrio sp. SCSIO 43136]USD65013.1 MSHA biogenesis protein MshP [Vibrio sp. SCSIO 43136]
MSLKKNQSGSVLIVSIFVIVVMGMLGLTLTRLEWSNQDTLTREVLGTQAWFAANSGSEWGLVTLYPLNGDSAISDLSDRCSDGVGNFSAKAVSAAASIIADIPQCQRLEIACDEIGSGDLTFFKITSTAVCGSQDFEVQREQEVWARGLE